MHRGESRHDEDHGGHRAARRRVADGGVHPDCRGNAPSHAGHRHELTSIRTFDPADNNARTASELISDVYDTLDQDHSGRSADEQANVGNRVDDFGRRVAIARRLILEPEVLLLDEPTSALDVSVQAEISNLLTTLRQERQLTYRLVSHDLAVIAHMCSKIAIMRGGEIVGKVPIERLRSGQLSHPNWQRLLAASQTYGKVRAEKVEA